MSIWSGYVQDVPEDLKIYTEKTDPELEWTYVNPEYNGPPAGMLNNDFDFLIKELVRKKVFDV